MIHLGGLAPAETAAKASLCCPLSPGVGPCSPSMAEAGSMEMVAQAIMRIPGPARDVLPVSYIPTLEVPYRELVLLQYLLQGDCFPGSGALPVFSCS